MSFRFSRRITIAPGVSINLGKKGVSVSVGPRGAKTTFGRNGVRTSVGIPGTGMRYEKKWASGSSGGGGGFNLSPWFIGMIAFGVIAFFAYQVHTMERAAEGPIWFMISAAVMAIVCLIGWLFSLMSSETAVTGYATRRRTLMSSQTVPASYAAQRRGCQNLDVQRRYDAYVKELIGASTAFLDFIKELNRSTRFRRMLKEFGGLESFDSAGRDMFSVTPRLAAIVYCDLCDCFRKLGYFTERLTGLPGVGYAMMVCGLLKNGEDLSLFENREYAAKAIPVVTNLAKTGSIEMTIKGHEDEFRFGFLFGTVKLEHEWVQRYATHMYRWASLVAKADGTISDEESATLAAIMEMKTSNEGNIPVARGRNEMKGSDIPEQTHQQSSESMSDADTGQPSLEEALSALDGLIGLQPVKNDVRMLANFIRIQKKRQESGLKGASVSYHCVFTGNPGTGKTTVARILADVYRTMGVVKRGHLVETDRSGLIGEYVGQTAVKTNKVIDSALDGVLFIDEAYTLVQGGERDYGGEAIATLLKRMEDDRNRLVVILAGYTDEMRKFIDSNPGLQSRFSRSISFPDYQPEELASIFIQIAEKSQYVCDADVQASLLDIMKNAVEKKDKNFGNGRFVRNLFERAIQRQAVRLSKEPELTTEMLSGLTLHDLGFSYED